MYESKRKELMLVCLVIYSYSAQQSTLDGLASIS